MMGWLTKKRLFAVHGWLGIVFGLPLFVICLAGACAVMAPEIDRAIHSDMRITPPADPAARPLPWGELLAEVEEACPGAEVFLLNAAETSDGAWSAVVNYSATDSRLVFFDPYTGAVQSQRTSFNAQSFFRIFHKQFYIIGGKFLPHGRLIVCSFSIVLLFSAVTGLMFYKSWWKSLLRLRPGKGLRVFFSDLHRFVGVWTFLLAMLFAVTGLWYLLERVMEDLGIAQHEPTPRLSAEIRSMRPPLAGRLPLDELAERARAASSLPEIGMILLGNQPDGLTGFHFKGGGVLTEDKSNRVYLDPYTGGLVERMEAESMGWGARLESMVNPLHFGRFGGWLTKVIWVMAGLAISAGILTGAWIHWTRTRKAGGGIGKGWSRAALVLNLMILSLAGVSTVAFIRGQTEGPMNPTGLMWLGRSQAGPWMVEAFRHFQHGKSTSSVSFRFTAPEDPNFRRAYGWTGGDPKPDGLAPLKGNRRVLFGKAEESDGVLQLGIEGWDGTTHMASFPRMPGESHVIQPPGASGPSWGLWTVIGVFFAAAGAPAVIWLVRLR